MKKTVNLIMEFDMMDAQDFYLVAIQCYHYPYRLAYLINQYFGVFLEKVESITFEERQQKKAHHCYANKGEETPQWYLLSNTSTDASHHMVPEHSSVTYFLKVDMESTHMRVDEIVQKLHELPDIFDVYTIDTTRLKSINNLLF